MTAITATLVTPTEERHAVRLGLIILTIVLLGIILAGSIWVMYHMNANMMPGMGDAAGMTGHGNHDMQ